MRVGLFFTGACAVLASCSQASAPVNLPASPTSDRIASLAEPYTTGLEKNHGEGDVETYVPEAVLSIARTQDPGMLRRASDYPSYIVQLELCGQDGEWLLEDFEQRLDSRAISGDYRLMFMRILSTGRGFHEGSFRTKLTEEGQESLVYLCDGKSPDTFRRFVEQDAYGTID